MRKIANTTELTSELERILDYAGSYQPSRVRLAAELRGLSLRTASLKMNWRPVGDKKYEMSGTEMWEGRVVKYKKTDQSWHAEISYSGGTYFHAMDQRDFDTPEEAMAAAEEGIRAFLKKELAKFT